MKPHRVRSANPLAGPFSADRQSSHAATNDLLSRRRFVASTAGLGLAALALSADGGPSPSADAADAADQQAKSAEAAIPVVDTHQHLWDLSKLHLSWINDPKARHLHRSFLVKDYDEATAGINIVKTVYMEVNSIPPDREAEADYVINLCKSPLGRMRGAVIGGPVQARRFGDYIRKYATDPYVKGVRMVLHDPDREKGMCLEPQFIKNCQLLGELGLSFDLCMRPGELLDGVRLAEQCPQTRFIIDHCGNWDVQSTDRAARAEWEHGIRAAATHENIFCKISGIVVNAKPGRWQPADLAPTINFCLDAFGEDRVFFGGDWPVCTKTASFRQWFDALNSIVQNRSVQFRRKLFHDNAVKFYRLS